MKYKVTVYITNYNYGHFIEQAIESVIEQTLQDIELIIIDDGSTDNSSKIIEQYRHNPNVVIVYQQNRGLNITNNIALQLSRGEYIIRLDADDYFAPTALKEMVDILDQNNHIGLVFPDYFLVDRNRTVTAEIKRHNFNESDRLLDQPAHGACTMIRKDFLKTVGGYDESYTCQDGYELWIKFISKYPVININKPLFYYRQHGSNLTSNEDKILGTRQVINTNFVKNNNIKIPRTLCIIPIRGSMMNGDYLAFKKLGSKTLLEIKIESALKSEHISNIVVTSNVPEIEEFVKSKYNDFQKVSFAKRTKELERFNVSLDGTIKNILKKEYFKSTEAFMILPIEFPFVTSSNITDAINTLTIFGSDSLLTARAERASLYQHHGNGMIPILDQDKFTKLEREALFKSAGGITLTHVNSYIKYKKILAGKVGHIILGEKESTQISSEFDMKIAEYIHTI